MVDNMVQPLGRLGQAVPLMRPPNRPCKLCLLKDAQMQLLSESRLLPT